MNRGSFRMVVVCLCVIMIDFMGTAQNTFLKTIGTAEGDYGTSCIPSLDGGSVLITGGGMSGGGGISFGLVKTDQYGTIEWSKLYANGNFALAKNVIQSSDGGFCIFGEVTHSMNAKKALFLLKTDSLGNEIWNSRIETSASDRPANVIACNSGGYLTCSIGDYNSSNYPNAHLVRYDENGSIVWAKQYSVFQGVKPKSVLELPNGDFAFVSQVNTSFLGPFQHILLTRTDNQGNLIWSRMFYGDYEDEPHDVISNADGDLFVAGATARIASQWDGFFLEADGSGNLIRNVFYDAQTSSGEQFRSVSLTQDGNLALLGDAGGSNERNVSLLKVTPFGEILWSRQYPLSPNFTNYGFDGYEAQDNGFVFTGDIRPPNYFRDAALFKTDDQGMISCHVQDLNYTRSEEPFSEMDIFMAQLDNTQITQTAISFTNPPDPITEKLICEEKQPVVQFNSTQFTNCPFVCVDFTDGSLNNPTSWFWEFENGIPATSTDQNPQVCYSQGGNHLVQLTVSNADGSATLTETITLNEIDCPFPEVPNVFTPNGDGINDLFQFPVFSEETSISICNRWGTVVYKGEGYKISWDGKTQLGIVANEGVYFYKIKYNGGEKHGFLQLVR